MDKVEYELKALEQRMALVVSQRESFQRKKSEKEDIKRRNQLSIEAKRHDLEKIQHDLHTLERVAHELTVEIDKLTHEEARLSEQITKHSRELQRLKDHLGDSIKAERH